MPPGVPPIALFRTFARNLPMAKAMRSWGAYELSGQLSLSMRQREIVIDRVTARCGCEYEWGVHIAFFAERVGLTHEQVSSLTHGSSTDPCWDDPGDPPTGNDVLAFAAGRAALAIADAAPEMSTRKRPAARSRAQRARHHEEGNHA